MYQNSGLEAAFLGLLAIAPSLHPATEIRDNGRSYQHDRARLCTEFRRRGSRSVVMSIGMRPCWSHCGGIQRLGGQHRWGTRLAEGLVIQDDKHPVPR